MADPRASFVLRRRDFAMLRAGAVRLGGARPLSSASRPSFFQWWRDNVIKPIHSTRILLPDILGVPAHQYMQVVYPIPVIVGGYYIMQWAIGRSHESIGESGEKLRERDGFAVHSDVASQRAALQKILDDAKRRKEG